MITVYQFMEKLNKFFPSNEREEIFKERVNEYSKEIMLIANERKVKYDYDKIFSYILKNYEYKTFPALAYIIKVLDEGIIQDTKESIKIGNVLVVTMSNGLKYDFVISNIGKTKEEIIGSLTKKYGKCKIDEYPAGTVIMGNKIFLFENGGE